MKLAMIGTGMIVNDCFRFFDEIPDLEVKAIVSTPRSEDKAIELCQKYNIEKHYIDVDEMLQDQDIEVVYVGVPNHLHYEMCQKALLAHKHVICEKPFTSCDQELKELIHIAKENNLILLEAISTQYLPNVQKIKETLPQLGNIKIVSANYSQYSSRYQAFQEGHIMPAFDYTKSGGALMDLNIYNIHLMVALFGKPLKVHYQANIEKGIDTSGILTLDYGTFQCVCIGAKDCKAPIMSSIQGDQGCIVIQSPANVVSGYQVMMNQDQSHHMDHSVGQVFDYQQGKHRMYFEFMKFVDVFKNKDMDFVNQMLDISLTVMEIQTQARKEAGIRFLADR